MRTIRIQAFLAMLLVAGSLAAQSLTLPPSGDNQKSSVIQHIGLVEVRLDYSSPDVTAPNGEDRTGKIWGQLVPYGFVNLGFGPCKECPWRAGANENTIFSVSHDVLVEGQALAAGTYGFHMAPGETEWTIIFSNNTSSWGSYFYDPAEDALRVKVKPKENAYTHWLTYEFTDRQPEQATFELQWENLAVPVTITVDNMTELYVTSLREELRSSPGFSFQGWVQAASYCLQNETNLEEALEWAQNGVSAPFGIGQENFSTLAVLARAQWMNGLESEGEATLVKAVLHPSAPANGAQRLARQMAGRGQQEPALRVFRKALESAGDGQRADLESAIKSLEESGG